MITLKKMCLFKILRPMENISIFKPNEYGPKHSMSTRFGKGASFFTDNKKGCSKKWCMKNFNYISDYPFFILANSVILKCMLKRT